MEYLTPKDYEIAESNGIGKERLYQRYYVEHWSKERSTTQPVKSKDSLWGQYKDVAIVSANAFYVRIRKYSMTPLEAATTPRQNRHNPKCPISPEIRELAKKNGIKFTTLRNRIYEYKWTPEDAASLPVGSKRPGRRKRR